MQSAGGERGRETRKRPAGGGEWPENAKKILNRRNELKDLLNTKDLALFGVKNELKTNSILSPNTMLTLEDCRHFYVEEVRCAADLSSPALVEAYARVPREKDKPLEPDRKGQVSCLGRQGRIQTPGGLHISDPAPARRR